MKECFFNFKLMVSACRAQNSDKSKKASNDSCFTIRSKNLIKVKESVPRSLHSFVAYKFTCAGCNSVYVGETC